MRAVVASHYAEGSTVAVARALDRSGLLSEVWTSLAVWSKLPAVLQARLGLERYRVRNSFGGIDRQKVHSLATGWETVYAFARRFPPSEPLTARIMYRAKLAFDGAAGRRLPGRRPDVVVAVWGAAMETFLAAKPMGTFCVLNFVNGHPSHHNAALAKLAGLSPHHPEMIPPAIATRVQREIALADLILAPSQAVRQQLLASGAEDAAVAHIPYGTAKTSFRPQTAPTTGSGFHCLYVGQISHRKGIPALCAIAEELRPKGVRFTVVGPLVSREVLRDCPGNVTHLPGLPHAEVARVMSEADVFLFPSLEDSFGLVVIEAMASGLPVIVSPLAGASELIEHQRTGFVLPPLDVPRWVKTIEALWSHPELRQNIAAGGQSTVDGCASWEQYGDRVIEAVRERRSTP